MFNTELLQQAEDELSDAFKWYEEKVTGLGAQFYQEVDHYIDLITTNPFHFPIRYADDLRAAALDRFPFWSFIGLMNLTKPFT